MKKEAKKLKHLKEFRQFMPSEYEVGGVATEFATETEDFMVMKSSEDADYSAVFTNEDGEYITIELTRSLEPISGEGFGKMGVVEGTATDGREYSAVGKYEKMTDEIFGDLWSLKSIAIESI